MRRLGKDGRPAGTGGGHSRGSILCVLGFAVAERPVLPGYFDDVDEEILRSQAGGFCQKLDDAAEKGALLCGLAAGAHGDLHEDDFIRALDAEVLRVVEEILRRIFGDDLEAIVWRNGDGI